jgi:hypothetical protein
MQTISQEIARVVLPNRPAENEADCSEAAAGSWTGQNQNKRPSDLAGSSVSVGRADISVYHDMHNDPF